METLSPTESDPRAILDHLRRGPRAPFEQLMSLLLGERDGILGWMLEGFRDFKARGLRLAPPERVSAATEGYFEDEDIVGRFVKDWCSVTRVPAELPEAEIVGFIRDPKNGTCNDDIHRAFTAWSQFGKNAWGKPKVTRRLQKVEGVVARRGTGNRLFLNLVLNERAREARCSDQEEAEKALF
jgi:hypothetical protein